MSKLMYKIPHSHVYLRDGVCYFVRRIPADLRPHYSVDRISFSLRTKSVSAANRSARSITQRLDDYWLGLRLQKVDIPGINLIKTDGLSPADQGCLLSEALDLYLRLKGADRDKIFVRLSTRNVGYVVRVLGDKPIISYTTIDAAKFRDWLIDQGMGRNTVKRVFSSIRSIVNLAISELGIETTNPFAGTYIPDSLESGKRLPIPIDKLQEIQRLCVQTDDDPRWLIALLSDTGMRLGEAVGLLKSDLIIKGETPHVLVQPHPWRRLKTAGSERKIPLVGLALWATKRILERDSEDGFAFPRYCSQHAHKSNSASATLNKWLRANVADGYVVHSLRHSMRDRLRAVECPADVIDRIGGWTTAGIGQGYGTGYPLDVLHRWMARTNSNSRH